MTASGAPRIMQIGCKRVGLRIRPAPLKRDLPEAAARRRWVGLPPAAAAGTTGNAIGPAKRRGRRHPLCDGKNIEA